MQILFITANRIGDAILSSGLLAHLAQRYPDGAITLACGPLAAPLFAGDCPIEKLIVLRKQSHSRHWWHLWRQVIGTVWDLVVDLRNSAVSRLIAARERRILRPSPPSQHSVIHYSNLLAGDTILPPLLWPGFAHHEEAIRWLPAADDPRPILAIGPTANWPGKEWPSDRFIALIEQLSQNRDLLPEAYVAVFGGPGERQAAQPVLNAIPVERRIDLVGKLDLLTAHACLQRCRLYIGNDSGLMHLSAAASVPTLGLFGPSRESQFAPWGRHCRSVRGAKSFEDIVTQPDYDHRLKRSWMHDLEVDTVLQAAKTLLAHSDPQAANP